MYVKRPFSIIKVLVELETRRQLPALAIAPPINSHSAAFPAKRAIKGVHMAIVGWFRVSHFDYTNLSNE
jgi:hypothetical protein